MKVISIVIPAYNEEKFISTLLETILKVPTESLGYQKEIIVVDDGSKDSTFEKASAFPEVKAFKQVPNQGKGRAVQRGIAEATGDYVLVQDADLEYDPKDYLPMLRALQQNPQACIYGSRTWGEFNRHPRSLFPGKHHDQDFGPWAAGVLLSGWTFLLYGKLLTDTLTAYKLYPTSALRSLDVKTAGFETDHELTAKLIRSGIEIVEVPLSSYLPRTKEEGKKIRLSDGFKAVWTLARFRI